jgi:Asp-tRNA(Asn)/Glu-tRNA(Gln) amidotransferase A subunit family amidase
MNLERLSLTDAASDIRAGRLSPVEYVQALFSRIEKVDSRVHAWTTVDQTAVLAEARRCEAEARERKFRGPLHGVPVGIKDIFYTKALRTTAGSKRFENFVPDYDARSVAQLKKAGAIILGKCVTTEFATFDPGPTRNPWNTSHTPGGSSSGSAAAVAAGMCPAATGSQTVASIGRPAAFCGVVGLMPTQARVSRAGVFLVSWSLDHIGGFARSVADMATFLAAMTEESLEKAEPPKRIRVGLVRDFYFSRTSEEARRLTEAAVARLPGSDFDVIEVRLPELFDLVTPSLMTIMRAEVASAHETLHRENATAYGTRLRALVETGMLIDSTAYLRAVRIRKKLQRTMLSCFENADVLVTPGATGTAPEGMPTGDPVLSGPWTALDYPTLTLPIALAANGMPVGIQITARPMQDPLLLAIAGRVEQAMGFSATPQL